MKNKAQAMVLASLAADSLALGAHWIYDTEKIEKDIGRVDRLLAPPEKSYHPTKKRGEFTHYGDQTLLLLESICEKGAFDLEHSRLIREDTSLESLVLQGLADSRHREIRFVLDGRAGFDLHHDVRAAAQVETASAVKNETNLAVTRVGQALKDKGVEARVFSNEPGVLEIEGTDPARAADVKEVMTDWLEPWSRSDEGSGTRYVATVMHPDKATRDRHEEMGFFQGWNTCIDQLEAFALQLH